MVDALFGAGAGGVCTRPFLNKRFVVIMHNFLGTEKT
jgi:hypothetical protein